MFAMKPIRFQGTALAVSLLIPWTFCTAAINESTADHSKFEALDKEFATGSFVTNACLSFHTYTS